MQYKIRTYGEYSHLLDCTSRGVLSITVGWNKLEIILYTLFVLSCPAKLTGLCRTVSIFVACYATKVDTVQTKMV